MTVAPLTGAWIETEAVFQCLVFEDVAPLTGAWIETMYTSQTEPVDGGRAPHGRVD